VDNVARSRRRKWEARRRMRKDEYKEDKLGMMKQMKTTLIIAKRWSSYRRRSKR
jgi:hypothetical protein